MSEKRSIEIWLAIHAVQCWWNDRPIRGGVIDTEKLEAMMVDIINAQDKAKQEQE